MPSFEGDAEVHSVSGQWRATTPLCKVYTGVLTPVSSHHTLDTHHQQGTSQCAVMVSLYASVRLCAVPRHTQTESQVHDLMNSLTLQDNLI